MKKFSWREPWLERNEVYYCRPTTLPKAVVQGDEPSCTVHSLWAAMIARMKIYARRCEQVEPPSISLQRLVYNFRDSPTPPSVLQMISSIQKHGIEAEHDWGRDDHEVQKYYIEAREVLDGCFNQPDVTDLGDTLISNVKELVLEGPIVAVLPGTAEYNPQIREVYNPKKLPVINDGSHAVCLTGWGENKLPRSGGGRAVVWEYLNSWGEQFGRDGGYGEVELDGLAYVYSIDIKKWWK